MIPLAGRFAEGVEEVIRERCLPWHVVQLGARVEYRFSADPPRNGGEAATAVDPELEKLMHLYAMNRGILLTPFHNMALMSPYTTRENVDYHTEVFAAAVSDLMESAEKRSAKS
jgi:glutamate-1-semialdehyde 2,1-aminomutase